MANKQINDLQLRSAADATINFPVDDASQTWRVTGAQLKEFIKPSAGGSVTTNDLAAQSVTVAKLANEVMALLLPTAMVVPYAAPGPVPNGFLECDGALVSRTTYADLFAKIGVAHGAGNGSTTFALPDYRGRFLRGVTTDATRDPDFNTRTAMNTGGNTGGSVGSVQGDAFTQHVHQAGWTSNGQAIGGGPYNYAFSNVVGGTYNTGGANTGAGNETRPKNANVRYMVKT